ncbi:hypothetical protein T07_2228 [Trichinella nelsoni]|uniref:Uncharacterized protein n=1 Tax=Trichinella nelsoni TaxID=6336 RepID=A0A0V0RSW1_9BILA|nr:hypothetical protein T07_2228 [Trichinella nelsoni]
MPDRLLGDKFSKSSPLNFCSGFGQPRCFALGNGSSLNQAVLVNGICLFSRTGVLKVAIYTVGMVHFSG